jgi:hypothetical protein
LSFSRRFFIHFPNTNLFPFAGNTQLILYIGGLIYGSKGHVGSVLGHPEKGGIMRKKAEYEGNMKIMRWKWKKGGPAVRRTFLGKSGQRLDMA